MDSWCIAADVKLSEQSKALEAKIGCAISFSGKWDTFISHPSFISKSATEQQRIFLYMSQNSANAVVNSIAELCTDAIVKGAILDRFRQIVFQFDPNNAINANTGNYSNHYIVQKQGSDLVVTINLDKYGDMLHNFKEKLELVLDVRTDQDRRDARQALDKLQDDLRSKSGLGLFLDIDFSFATDTSFLAKSLDERTKVVKQIYQAHFPRIITSSDGIFGLSQDDIMKRTIQGRFSNIVMRLDPMNSINSSVGGNYARHYETTLESNALVVTINADKYGDTLHNFKDKIEVLLNVRVEQDKRDTHAAIAKLVAEVNQKLGFFIDIGVDWEFTNHTSFTSKSLDDQTKIIKALYVTHLPRVLNSSDGLTDLTKDTVMKTAIQSRIGRAIITYNPNNTIDSSIGGNYSRHFETVLQGANLVINVNMEKYADTLYNFKDKIEVLLNVRVEQEKRNAHEAFEKIAAELKAKLGVLFGVLFDWQFTEHAVFKSKSLDDQSKIIKQVYTVHASRVLTSGDGLADIFKDDIMRHAIESQVSRVVFSYDPENKVESPIGGNYSRHYETVLSGKDLVIRINMDKYGDALYNFKEKIDVLFNVRVEQEKRNSIKPIKEIEQNLNAKLGFAIELGVDWIFTHHSDFTSKPLDEQSKIIRALYQTHLPRIMTSGDGLADLAKDATIKEAIRERIRSIHATYDAENRISSTVGGNYGRHFEVLQQGSDLHIPINMKQYGDALYSFKEKLEVLLNVRTEQEKRAANVAMKGIMENLAKALGFSIDVDIDWKFTNHSDFTSKSLDDQSKIIRAIHQIHLPRVLTSGDGIITLAKDELVKRTIQDQVKQILFVYDPLDQVNSAIGGNYGKHYDVTLSSCVLLFTVNMKQYGDALYSSLEKIETSLSVRIAKEKRDATKALSALQSQLSASIGDNIEIEIDWSFTLSGNFISKTLNEYSSIIQSIWKTSLPRLVNANDSISAILNQNNDLKINALSKFRRIVYCIDFNNSVNAQVGDKSWEIKLQPPVLQINVNLSQFSVAFYNIKDKLVHAINNPETSTGDFDAARRLLEEHEAKKAEQDRLNMQQYEEEQRKKTELEAQRSRNNEEKQRLLLEERKREEEERARRLQQEQEQEADRVREELERSQKASVMASQRSIEPLPIAALMPVNNFATPSPQPSIVTPTPLPTPTVVPTPTPMPTPTYVPTPTPIPVHAQSSIPEPVLVAQVAPIVEVQPQVAENPLLVEVKKKIAKECDDFAKKVGFISVNVNWDEIVNHPKFTAKSDYEKKRLVDPLANITAFILNRNSGLADLSNDAVLKQAILSRIRVIEVAVDFDDAINDNLANYAQNYSVKLNEVEGLLMVTVNAKAVDGSLTNFNHKIEVLLNTRVEQEISKSKLAIKPIEDKFKQETGLATPIEIDFAFTKHSNFLEEGQRSYSQLERYSRIISQLYRTTIPSFVVSNNESLQFKCKDEIIKEAVASRVKKIVFTFDPENRIADGQHSNYYELVLDSEGALHVKINLSKFDSNLYHVGQKIDRLLNVRLAQDKRAAYKAIADIEARFKKDVGFEVKIDIDWSFATHEQFTKEDLDWRSSRISRLAHSTITSFLFSATDNIQSLCKDAMIKNVIQELIANIVFTYSPDNKVDDQKSLGAHEKFYALGLNSETKTLVFTMNLDKYDSNLYNLMHKMKELLHLFDNLAKRSATTRLHELRDSFLKDVPSASGFEALIDWSFLEKPGFATLNGTERERLIVELASSYASRVLRSVGLDGLFKDPINGQLAADSIKAIEFTYDSENKVNAPYNGNQSPFYALTYLADSKRVKLIINLSSAQRRDNLYHVLEKLDDLLCFGIRTAQFKSEQLFNDLSVHVKNSCQYDIKFAIDYTRFISHPKFLSCSASQRATYITQLASNINSLWRNNLQAVIQKPKISATVKGHVKLVTVTYDCERDQFHNLSKAHVQKYYTVDYLVSSEELAFTLALSYAKESMNYMAPMVEWTLNIATAQHEGFARIAQWEAELNQKCGQPVQVVIDWSGLHLNKELYDNHNNKELEVILNKFLGSARTIVDTILSIVRVYPNCQQLFTSQIKGVKLVATTNSAPLQKVGETLVVTDGFKDGGFKGRQNDIEYLLDISIPLWKYRAAVAFLGHATNLRHYMPDFSFEIDWTYLGSEEFKRLGCNPMYNILSTMTDKFGKALVKCFEGILTHPISLSRVGTLKKVIIAVEPIAGHYQVKFENTEQTAIKLVLNKQGVQGAMDAIARQSDLKEAIEDIYGLIVDIALYDTAERFEGLQKTLESVFGKSITVDIPTAFLSSDNVFLGEAPRDRSKYIRDLFDIFGHALLVGHSSLTTLGEHPTSKDIVKASVDSVLIELQPAGRGVQLDYDAAKKQIIAKPALNQLATRNREWKYDLLPLLGAEIPVLQYDINQLVTAFETKFVGATGLVWKFEIDWPSVLGHPEFISESSKAKFHALSNLSGVVLDNTLLGANGIQGLLEVPTVKTLFASHFKTLVVRLDNTLQIGYQVSIDASKLILNYSWHVLFNFNNVQKLKPILDDLLNLRPMIERHFITLVDGHLAQLMEEVKFVLDKDIDITVDWPFLLGSTAYQDSLFDYQHVLREKVTHLPTTLIKNLTTLAKQNIDVLRAVKDCVQEIVIRPNPANDSSFTLGSFTNSNVGISLVRGGSVLMFEVNLSARDLECTLNLQWVFTPRNAQGVESDIQDEIDENIRRQEEEDEAWRQQQMEREFERKMQEQERNQRDLERKMQDADRRAADMMKKQKDIEKTRADADKKMKELDKKRAEDLKKAQQSAQAAEQKQREFERKQKELEKKQAEADKKRQEAEKKQMEEEKKRRELEKKNAEIEKKKLELMKQQMKKK